MDTIHWIRANHNPVWSHFKLITSANILIPKKITLAVWMDINFARTPFNSTELQMHVALGVGANICHGKCVESVQNKKRKAFVPFKYHEAWSHFILHLYIPVRFWDPQTNRIRMLVLPLSGCVSLVKLFLWSCLYYFTSKMVLTTVPASGSCC